MPEFAELLTRAVNFAVVQLPGRQFPGVVVQGDTLNQVVRDVDRMSLLLAEGQLEELADTIEGVKELLVEAREHYEHVCAGKGIGLPYPKA